MGEVKSDGVVKLIHAADFVPTNLQAEDSQNQQIVKMPEFL